MKNVRILGYSELWNFFSYDWYYDDILSWIREKFEMTLKNEAILLSAAGLVKYMYDFLVDTRR